MPKPRNLRVVVTLVVLLAVALPLRADRTQMKPGFNLFSPQQDVEMGRQVAQDAERQLPMLNNRQAQAYIDSLGRQLASRAPGEKYPYQFKIVNDKSINAFALPGGFVYVNRGTIEAAQNEAQLASVIAHEIGHVALRHGTNQVTKAYATQGLASILGGVLGGNSVGSVLGQLGIGFGANSILLKNSRDAERQADLMGAQILYDSGYDPTAMVAFFEKLQSESKGRAIQFFSNHPNPENRIVSVKSEIQKLGGVPARARLDSADFQGVKAEISGTPAPRSSGTRNGRRPSRPSSRYIDLNLDNLSLRYPENWLSSGEGAEVSLAPDGGFVSGSLAYGMIAGQFESRDSRNRRMTVEAATDQLLDELSRSNPNMRIVRERERIRVGGQSGLFAEASNDSPAGGREIDWVITVLRPDGTLSYFVAVAPQSEFSVYQDAFEDVLNSVRFR